MATDVVELLFKAITQDDGGLSRIDDAVKRIAKSSGLAGEALKVVQRELQGEFQKANAAGLTFEQTISRIVTNKQGFGSVAAGAKAIKQELQNAADAAKNLAQQQRAVQSLTTSIGSPLQAIGTAASEAAAALGPVGLAIAGIATAATLGGRALFSLVEAQGKAAEQLGNFASRLGLTINQASQLSAEAAIAGVNIGSLEASARLLGTALEDPAGQGKKVAQALREMGVASFDASGNARELGATTLDLIDKLSGYDSAAERSYRATQTLGRGAKELAPLIEQHRELQKVVQDLGYANVEQLNATLQKADDEIDKLSLSWKLFKSKLAEAVAPVVIPVVTELAKGLSYQGARPKFGTPYALQPAFETAGQRAEREQMEDLLTGAIQTALAPIRDRDIQKPLDAMNAANKKISVGYFGSSIASTIEEKTKELHSNEAVLANPTNVRTEVVQKAEADAKSLRLEIEALQESMKRAAQATSELRRLREDSRYPDLQSPTNFRRLIAERQKEIGIVGQSNAGLVDSDPRFGLDKINQAINQFFLKIGEDVRKDAERTLKDDSSHGGPFSLDNKAFGEYLKDQIKISEALYSESQKQLRIFTGSDREAAQRSQTRALRLAELQGGPGGALQAVSIGTQSRVSSAQALRNDDLAQIEQMVASINGQGSKSVDDEKQLAELTTQRLQVEATYRKSIDEARMDAELRILEIQKQQLDGYRQQAGQLFDALRRPNGLQEFVRGQATDLARGVFTNATAPILQSVGQSIAGTTSGLPPQFQKLFTGTILDSSRGKTPNVVALDTNTAALHGVTAALTGRAIGGQLPGSVASTVDGIARVGGGATPPFLSGGSTGASGSLGPLTKLFSGGDSGGGQFLDGVLGVFKGAKGGIGGGGFFAGLNLNAGQTGAFRAGNIIGSAGVLGGGIYESVNQFSKGGLSGTLGGIGAATGTAALLDPEPISKAILGGVSLFTGLFKSLLPDPKEIRAAQIANQTQYAEYVAPPTLNRDLSTGGFENFNDKYGMPTPSSYSSVAIQQPYKYLSPLNDPNSLYQTFATQPGQVLEPYQRPAPVPTYSSNQAPATVVNHFHISTMDAQSFLDNSGKIASAVQKEVVMGHPVGAALQQAIIGSAG